MLSPDDLPEKLEGVDGPLVSILLATYEPEKTIRESIQSVADQTYGNIELVIVDGSKERWLLELGENISWVTYAHQEGSGIANAWNEGVRAAAGEYISFLADDDYYVQSKTERQVDLLEGSEVGIVYSDEYIITPDGGTSVVSGLKPADESNYHVEYFQRGQGVPHLTVMGKRTCFEEHHFDETLEAREDPHLWVRMFRHCTPAYIPEPLAYKRRRADSLTADPEMMYRNELKEIQDLVNRFDELKPVEEERKQWAKYRYGRSLIDRGESQQARGIFIGVLRKDPTNVRCIAMLIVSILPIESQKAINYLEDAAYTVNQLWRAS